MAYYENEEDIQKDFNLVWGTIHKYGFDVTEDNFQIGCIGLLKANRKFDPSRQYTFSTFAYRCIRNEIYMYYRSKSRTLIENSCTSLDEIIGVGAEAFGSYQDALDIESDFKTIVFQAIDNVCNEETKAIFYDVCLKRMNGQTVTQTEIAKQYRMSPTKVSRHFRRINVEVKKILAGNLEETKHKKDKEVLGDG